MIASYSHTRAYLIKQNSQPKIDTKVERTNFHSFTGGNSTVPWIKQLSSEWPRVDYSRLMASKQGNIDPSNIHRGYCDKQCISRDWSIYIGNAVVRKMAFIHLLTHWGEINSGSIHHILQIQGFINIYRVCDGTESGCWIISTQTRHGCVEKITERLLSSGSSRISV